jgi:hypothetical protein
MEETTVFCEDRMSQIPLYRICVTTEGHVRTRSLYLSVINTVSNGGVKMTTKVD